MRTEAHILNNLNHPNIVKLVEVIVDNKMNDFILIEELIPGKIIMEESSYAQYSTLKQLLIFYLLSLPFVAYFQNQLESIQSS